MADERRPRIAFHSECIGGYGGADRYMACLAVALARNGWDVSIIVHPTFPVADLFGPEPPVTVVRYPTASEAASGPAQPDAADGGAGRPAEAPQGSGPAGLLRSAWRRAPRGWRLAAGYRRAARELAELADRHQFDLVHILDGGPHPFPLAAEQTGCPCVAGYHAPPPTDRGGIDRRLARASYQRAAACLAPSAAAVQMWAGYLGTDGAKFRVIPNGVDLQAYAPGRREELVALLDLPPGSKVVGFTGRVGDYKGADVVMAALPAVLEACPEAVAVFVGDGPLLPTLRERASQLGIDGRLRFAGWRHDAARFAQLYDVALVPSVIPETFGLTNIEAMAWGRPVVASRIGGIPEIVEDGVHGLLITPGKVDELAAAILRLLRDPQLADRLGRAGRERVEAEFTAEKMVERHVSLYQELLAHRSGHGQA